MSKVKIDKDCLVRAMKYLNIYQNEQKEHFDEEEFAMDGDSMCLQQIHDVGGIIKNIEKVLHGDS